MYKNLSMGALGHQVPFDQACALAQKNNFPGIDLDMGFLSRLAISKSSPDAKDWFGSTGLIAGSFGCSVAWRESDSDRTYADSLGRLVEEAKLAAELGCTRCVTWVMPCSDKYDFYQHFNLTVPRLRRVADILGMYGMMFGLEFVGPATLREGHKYDFVHTMDGMRTFAAAIGMDSLNTGLLLDCFHWWTAHSSVADLERLNKEEIVYVHVNDAAAGRGPDEQIDNEREMVGATGVIPIKAFIATLRKIGYDGPVTVEPFNKAIREMAPEHAAAVTSKALDKVLSN